MEIKKFHVFIAFLVIFLMTMSSVSATCNIIVITDPSGDDPNGAAAGSMSFAENMFQSTFLMSKNNHFAVLSGGTGSSDTRLDSIVEAAYQGNGEAQWVLSDLYGEYSYGIVPENKLRCEYWKKKAEASGEPGFPKLFRHRCDLS